MQCFIDFVEMKTKKGPNLKAMKNRETIELQKFDRIKFWIESRGVSWLVIVEKTFGNLNKKMYFSSKRNINFCSHFTVQKFANSYYVNRKWQ